MNDFVISWLMVSIVLVQSIVGYQFRFEVPDNDQECFGQELDIDTQVTIEYRVMSGGNLDIDVVVQSPTNLTVYRELRVQADNFHFTTTERGDHLICFSNQFSTITHKNVYLSLRFGGAKPVSLVSFPEGFVAGPLTFMETATSEMFEALEEATEYQTHFRMREAQSRVFAEEINERVLWWSIMQTFMIVVISITQAMVVRKFFDQPISQYPIRPRHSRYTPMVR